MGKAEVHKNQRLSFLSIIAWLSICLLVTGLFISRGMEFGNIWVIAGLFGLAASVGLSESAKTEARTQKLLLDTYISEARTDPLTGLANRRAFDLELERLCIEVRNEDKTLSLVLIDLDHFHQFNSQHGFHAGDEMLRAIARILRCKTGGIGIATRFGGEQFAVILPGMNLDKAQTIALKLQRAIGHQHFTWRGNVLQVTASAGVVQMRGEEEPQDLIVRVDECLFAAKEGGRDCVYVNDGETSLPLGPTETAEAPALV